MKILITSIFTLLSFINFAQVKLDAKDLKNLIAICELYSKNTNPNRQRILNRNACEQNGTPICQGTPNLQTQLGKPCN